MIIVMKLLNLKFIIGKNKISHEKKYLHFLRVVKQKGNRITLRKFPRY